ncbi:LamG-like jellyroll fold domain-containing protein [Kaistella sp.]|uniref:LamG-like jellyroll fold domain-containing protein n=1 Tax=Kaistella sp. TaxID=2782235 RepID=UPI002F93E1C3
MGIIPQDYILCYDFNGDYLDKSPNALHGIKTGTASFAAGSKPGKQCLEFTAGCVKTPAVLPVNSDKVTVSFGMKTTQTATSVLIEMSATLGSNNAFNVINNNSGANTILAAMRTTSINSKAIAMTHDGIWRHFAIEFNRSEAVNADKIKFYVNGNLFASVPTSTGVNVGNFVNNILFIGQRNASTFPFVGSLQNLKIYNRTLTTAEHIGLRSEIL